MTRCPRCGSADVVGGRYVHLISDHSAVLPCSCGACADGVAAATDDRRATLVREWGPLDADGAWAAEASEVVDGVDSDPPRTRVFCPACVAAADPADWAGRRGDATEDRLGQSPFLACHGCGAERMID